MRATHNTHVSNSTCCSDCLLLPPCCCCFLQDSHDLRDEMEALRLSLEQQMTDNTAAVQHLESQIRQLMALQGIDMTSMPPRPATVVAAAAVAPPPPGVASGRPSTPGSSGPPGSSEMLDPEDKLLLERINHLASDLSEEMKEAVQELELQQQVGAAAWGLVMPAALGGGLQVWASLQTEAPTVLACLTQMWLPRQSAGTADVLPHVSVCVFPFLPAVPSGAASAHHRRYVRQWVS